jgi:flavin reductase (DIM6/NTAB) family NADH-FMN oxidoreductase RutF
LPPDEHSEQLQRRSLRALLSAYAVSQLGNWLFRTGVVYYAYNHNNGSDALLTTAIVLVYLPILFGSRLLAPLADRRDTRRTLIGLDVLRAAVLAVLLAVVAAGTGGTSGATIGVLALLSLLTPFFTASQTAYLRQVLPVQRIPAALASVSRVDWSTFVVGTAAAPLMLEVSNLPTLIVLDIATFLVSGLLLVRLTPASDLAGDGHGDATASDRKPGLTLSSKWLLASIFLLNAGAGLINVYPNVVARHFLGGGAAWLSAINLANGVGGVLGATLAGRLSKQRGLRPGTLAALAVALSLACMTLVTTAWAAIISSSVMLMAGQVFAVVYQARILENEPVAVAGRISGFFTLGTFAGVTVSTLLFLGGTSVGPMRDSFTVVLVVGAASALVAALVGHAASRRYGDKARAAEAPTPHAGTAEGSGGSEDRLPDLDAEQKALLVRRAGRAFVTGVAVASTVTARGPHATTVNSFVTVSLDPALVMVSVECGSRLESLVAEDSPLGITILSARQRDTALHFARGDRPVGEGQFEGHAWREGRSTGAPLLEEGTTWLECRVHAILPAGDHSLVLARVVSFTSCDQHGHGPLVFFDGGFHTLTGNPPATAQEAEPVDPVPAGSKGGEK